jgi:predicted DNA-binding transcriptional regulator AlpA
MKHSNERHDRAGIDLFAYGTGRDGALSLREGDAIEEFPNAYAEASQASKSGKRPTCIDDAVSGDFDEAVKSGKCHQSTHQQSATAVGLTATAHMAPAAAKPEAAQAAREFPRGICVPRMMRASEVAAYLGVSVSKVWRLTKSESAFPHPVRIGSSTRWDRVSIDRHLDALSTRNGSGR